MIVIATLILIGIAIITFNQARGFNNIEVIPGTIRFINAEGGFWGILGNDGKRYDPIHLPLELRRPGLRVELTIRILEGHIGLRMWGTLVEILDYKIIY